MAQKFSNLEPSPHPFGVDVSEYVSTRLDKGKRLPACKIKEDTVHFLFAVQKGKCAICKHEICIEKGTIRGRRYRVHIDHCHSTGKIRGLLCGHCNLVIGFASDSTGLLLAAIAYLRSHGQHGISHGTHAGYMKERRLGLQTCVSCRAAANEYVKSRNKLTAKHKTSG